MLQIDTPLRTLHVTISRAHWERYKPEFFNLSNMVEVQVSFQVVQVGKHDYVFLPKLRSLCLINREAEVVSAIYCSNFG